MITTCCPLPLQLKGRSPHIKGMICRIVLHNVKVLVTSEPFFKNYFICWASTIWQLLH